MVKITQTRKSSRQRKERVTFDNSAPPPTRRKTPGKTLGKTPRKTLGKTPRKTLGKTPRKPRGKTRTRISKGSSKPITRTRAVNYPTNPPTSRMAAVLESIMPMEMINIYLKEVSGDAGSINELFTNIIQFVRNEGKAVTEDTLINTVTKAVQTNMLNLYDSMIDGSYTSEHIMRIGGRNLTDELSQEAIDKRRAYLQSDKLRELMCSAVFGKFTPMLNKAFGVDLRQYNTNQQVMPGATQQQIDEHSRALLKSQNKKVEYLWRELIEKKAVGSPTSQCNRIITNKTQAQAQGDICYLCGQPMINGHIVHCEHILPILLAVTSLSLAPNDTLTPIQKELLKYEYLWSHGCCNTPSKNDISIIKIDPTTQTWVKDDDNIKNIANNVVANANKASGNCSQINAGMVYAELGNSIATLTDMAMKLCNLLNIIEAEYTQDTSGVYPELQINKRILCDLLGKLKLLASIADNFDYILLGFNKPVDQDAIWVGDMDGGSDDNYINKGGSPSPVGVEYIDNIQIRTPNREKKPIQFHETPKRETPKRETIKEPEEYTYTEDEMQDMIDSIVPSRKIMKMIEETAIEYLKNYDPANFKTTITPDILTTNLSIEEGGSYKLKQDGGKYTKTKKNKKRKKSKKTKRKKSKR